MLQYFLVDPGNAMPRWCQTYLPKGKEDEGFQWMDPKGGIIPLQNSKILAVAEGNTLDEAHSSVPDHIIQLEQDFASMYLLDPWSEQGWLAPNGKFYGCKFYNHDDIAYAFIRQSPQALEANGWARVHEEIYARSRFYGRDDITKRQLKTLIELGFDRAPYSSRRLKVFEIDRSQPAPKYAIKPKASLLLDPFFQERFKPSEEDLFKDFMEKLNENETLKRLLETDYIYEADAGPGSWDFIFRWDDLYIGSPLSISDLLNEKGLCFHKTSGDTIEIEAHFEAGIYLETNVEQMLTNILDDQNVLAI